MSSREKKTSPFKVLGIICLIILIFTSAWVIAVKVVFKNQNVTPSIGNISLYVVRTSEMEAGKDTDIKQDTLLFVNKVVPTRDDIGKVIVVNNVSTRGTVAVRLRDIITENNAAVYEVGFDKIKKSYYVNSDQIDGIATKMDHFLGWVIVQSGTVHGMLLIVLTPLLLMIVFFALHSWWKQKNNAKKYMGHKEKVRELERQVEAIEAEKTEVVERLIKEKEELLEANANTEDYKDAAELTPVEEIVEIKEEIKQSASNTAIEELLRLCEEENQKLMAKFNRSGESGDEAFDTEKNNTDKTGDEDVAEAVKKAVSEDKGKTE